VSAQPIAIQAGASDGADAAAPLDLLLAAAALGPARHLLPVGAGVRFAGGLARRPERLARRATSLAGELARVGLGRSTLEPAPGDRRFTDPAWTTNPLLRCLVQTYLAAGQTTEGLVADADLEWRDAERLRLLVDNLVPALAPSNQPVASPAFWKALIDSGGGSAVRGVRQLAADLATPPRVPSTVPADAFEVGADLAVTPGAVVLRTPMFELLQYRPQTPRVRRVPLLVVAPTINKYYIVDLAPGRSLVEYLVASGQQVFVVSWRNPDARHRDWGTDAYGQAILEALAATRRICRADRSLLLGLCSGGILTAMALAYLAGRPPPPFDILYWNADTTRMPAGLHRDLMRLAVDNALTRPGAATMLGSPVDLAKVDTDTYLLAGIADHLCPWQACYRSTQLLGGRARFVLSTSGHVASMVNPPGNPRASFRTAPDTPPDPADWLDQAVTERGSWWPDYVGWLEQRGGGTKARPRRLGGAGLPPLDSAPGTYVMDR
jgi:poly(3-hydroxyalkanoate) synthetase